jgi:hypothetical protein
VEVAFFGGDPIYPIFQAVNLLVDVVFLADLVLYFFKAYENERGEVVTDMKKIRREYFKFWVFVDIPASIPFDNIFGLLGYELFGLKLFRLLRIGRLLKFLQKLQVNTYLESAESGSQPPRSCSTLQQVLTYPRSP